MNGLGPFFEQWLSRIKVRDHLRGLRDEDLDAVAQDCLGEPLGREIRQSLRTFATVRDRNAGYRNRLLPHGIEPFPPTYLSIRRVRNFFERVEDLRAIPGNEGKPLARLARAAIDKLMSPEGRAL